MWNEYGMNMIVSFFRPYNGDGPNIIFRACAVACRRGAPGATDPGITTGGGGGRGERASFDP